MRKALFIILISTLFASICNAQEKQKKFHIGPRIGFSICDIKTEGSWNEEDVYYDFYTNLSFFLNAGIMADYNWRALENFNFSLQITPHYNGKGCWLLGESNCYSGVEERVVKMYYFDVPIQIVGKYCISKRESIVFGLGPTFNIGICHSHNKRPNEHFQFGNGEGKNGLHRLDIGAVASIGLECIKGMRFDLNYFIPIRNLSINKTRTF